MGITLLTNASSTAGNGTAQGSEEGVSHTWTAYFTGTFGGASVSIEGRTSTAGSWATLDGSASTAPIVKLVTGRFHSLRGVVSTGGSTATSVSLELV